MKSGDLSAGSDNLVKVANWLIKTRRSCRKFNGKPVARELLEELAEAGKWGPTGANQQNIKFMLLDAPERMQALGKLKTQYKLVRSASAGILVVTDTSVPLPAKEEHIWKRLWPSNAAAAIQNILLLATAHGLGSCWLSFYKEMGLTRLTSGKRWRELFPEFDIPMHWDVQGLVLLGHTDEKDSWGFPAGDERHCGREVYRPPLSQFLVKPNDKRVRVCVTGSFGGGDIGDDAMVFPHLRTLKIFGVMTDDIYLIGHDPKYMAKHFKHPVNCCIKSDPFKPPEGLIDKTDLLLVTGGGTINTRDDTGYSIHRAHNLIMPFVRKKVPVIISGQTIGPLGTNPEHDKLAREIIDSVEGLTVRDKLYSRGYIEKIGAKPKQLFETCDDAAAIPYEYEQLPLTLPEGPKAAVNITVYTYDTPKKREVMGHVCRLLQARGYHVLLVPHHAWDFEHLKQLQAEAPGTTLVNTTGWRGSMSKKLLSECDLVVGGRYHVVVFAMTAGIPCVGMAGNEYSWIKQHGFADQAGTSLSIVRPECVTEINAVMTTIDEVLAAGATPWEPPDDAFEPIVTWLEERVRK